MKSCSLFTAHVSHLATFFEQLKMLKWDLNLKRPHDGIQGPPGQPGLFDLESTWMFAFRIDATDVTFQHKLCNRFLQMCPNCQLLRQKSSPIITGRDISSGHEPFQNAELWIQAVPV